MGFVLDTILIRELISSPESIVSNYVTPAVRIDDREAEFSIQLTFDQGISPDMEFSIEVSNDNLNFAKVTDSEQIILGDVEGAVLFDIFGSGAAWIRVAVLVNSGSLTLQTCVKKARRRH